MYKERLQIQSFLTLKNIDIELGKYNVFIGEQASGKSLIIKLLYYFRTILELHVVDDYNADILGNNYLMLFNQIFNSYFHNRVDVKIIYTIDKYSITIDLTKPSRVLLSSNLIDKYQECLIENQNKPKGGLSTLLPHSTLWGKIYDNSRVDGGSTFIPAGRVIIYNLLNNLFNVIGMSSSKVNMDYAIIKFGQEYQKARAEYEEYTPLQNNSGLFFEELANKILKGKFINNNDGGYLEQNGLKTPLINISSGQQEFLPIYLVLHHYFFNNFGGGLYVEEPEAHLYPTAQKFITELLVLTTNVVNENLYITTHSPYILTALNNLILAYDVRNKQKVFAENVLVKFEDVRAYFIENGTIRDLRDMENRLIVADNLDSVSEQNALEFDELLDLKYAD